MLPKGNWKYAFEDTVIVGPKVIKVKVGEWETAAFIRQNSEHTELLNTIFEEFRRSESASNNH